MMRDQRVRTAAPEGWRWARLGEICTLVAESVDPGSFPDEPFAHYSIPAFDAGRKPVVELGSSILSNKFEFPSGAVLFSKLNPRIARVWFVRDGHPYRRLCSTEFLPLVPNGDVRADFLVWALQEPAVIARLRSGVAAATKSRERLRPEQVLSAELLLPPVVEQGRMVTILNEQMAAIEKARGAAQAQLETATKLVSAYLRTVFAGRESFEWPRVPLGEILRLRKEVVHPRDNPSGRAVFVGLEHISPVLGVRVGSMEMDMAELTGRKPRFYKGDIVYGYLRPYLNKVWVAEFDGLCSVDQYVYSIEGSLAETEFVAWFMRSPVYLERAPIKGVPGWLPRIRTEEVAAVEINLPALEEQRRVLRRIEDVMSAASQLRKSGEAFCAAIDKFPACLLREALAGKL